MSPPLEEIGSVHRGRGDGQNDLTGSCPRCGDIGYVELLRSARTGHDDGAHTRNLVLGARPVLKDRARLRSVRCRFRAAAVPRSMRRQRRC